MSKYALPYDIYERHKKIGSFVDSDDTVLDLGGELNQLSNFCTPKKITVANLKSSQEKSDVIINKGKLPFKDGSFSVVCAIDVLEHIPKAQRKNFIEDAFRVCSKKTILSFPMGTQRHIKYEKELESWLEGKNLDVTYLKEHIKNGLPTENEIGDLTSGKKAKIYYSGDLAVNKLLFKLYIFDPKVRFIRKLIYLKKLIFNIVTNPILYVLLSEKKFSDKVVRSYVVIEK